MVCQPTYYEPHKRETLKICTSNEKKKKEKKEKRKGKW